MASKLENLIKILCDCENLFHKGAIRENLYSTYILMTVNFGPIRQ